jgi:hypothetical protein
VGLVGALLLGLACAAEPAPPVPAPRAVETKDKTPVIIEEIDETTVGDLDGTRVPMGNMTTGTYTMPDGSEKRGLMCSLVIGPGPGVFVGMGSEVTVDGTRWRVVGIEKDGDELGSVRLQKLD